MSFVDQGRNVRPASVAAVILVHAAIGYAVWSGLAVRVFTFRPPVTVVQNYKDDMPPPPLVRETLPPHSVGRSTSPQQLAKIDPVIPTVDHGSVTVGTYPAEDVGPVLGPPPTLNPSPATPDQSRGAGIVGDRAGWVTTGDYPASAARLGAEGTTAIRVTVGPDGKASDCRITASSGNPALDEAACRTYLRRARFRPALDRDGHAIASEHADRIKWVLPTD